MGTAAKPHKIALHILIFNKCKEKPLHHEISGIPRKIFRGDMFTLQYIYYLCIVDYHSKLPVIKKMVDLSADSLILSCIIIFSEYGLPKKIVSDAGSIFISDKFKRFYQNLDIEQAVSSSYHHLSNGQVEIYIKLIKNVIKCVDTNSDIYIALLQIRATPLGAGLPSTATLLFKHPIRGMMPILNRPLINLNNDDEHYKVIVIRQRMIRTMIISEIMFLFH